MAVLSLEQLCSEHWKAKTPDAVKVSISRGKSYPFLFKDGRKWMAILEEFNAWSSSEKRKSQSNRR